MVNRFEKRLSSLVLALIAVHDSRSLSFRTSRSLHRIAVHDNRYNGTHLDRQCSFEYSREEYEDKTEDNLLSV